jgi:hypothetical protein
MLQLMREMEVIRGCPVPRAYIDQWHLNGVGKGYKWRLAGRLCAAGYMVRIDTKWRQRPSVQYSVTSAGLALIAEYDRIYKDGYDWLRVKQEDHARNVKMYNKRASEADKARISAKLALLSKK